MSLDLSPLSFFEAKSGSLTVNSTDVENIGERKSEIVRFIRTPEGKGVGALRANGGEVWIATKRGRKLIRSAVWDTADFVVVLDYGKTSPPHHQSCWKLFANQVGSSLPIQRMTVY